MLGKLLKHDFKATGRILLPLNLILIGITLIGCLLLRTNLMQREEFLPLTIILILLYYLIILATSTITIIYLLVYFYKSLFSSQGYLSFTLPTSPWKLLHSKFIVGFAWELIHSFLMMASIFALILSAVGFDTFSEGMNLFWGNSSLHADNGEVMSFSLAELFGYTTSQFVIVMILFIIVSLFYSVTVCYASASLGQLFSKHKIGGTVLSFFSITIGTSVIATALMFAFFTKPLFNSLSSGSETVDSLAIMQSIYGPIYPLCIALFLIAGIICYIVSGIIMKKKVNLD